MFQKTIDKREIIRWGSESNHFASPTVSGEFKEQSDPEGPAVVIPVYGNAESLEIQADLESLFSNLCRVLNMSASRVCWTSPTFL